MSTYTIPYVVQQTPRGERTLDLYSRLLSERIIYLGTEIDDCVANAAIALQKQIPVSRPGPENRRVRVGQGQQCPASCFESAPLSGVVSPAAVRISFPAEHFTELTGEGHLGRRSKRAARSKKCRPARRLAPEAPTGRGLRTPPAAD